MCGGSESTPIVIKDLADLHALGNERDQAHLSKLLTRLKNRPLPTTAANLEVVNAAEESCKIFGMTGFYPERKVGVEYFERFTPILEQRLVLAATRLGGVLNRVLRSRSE